MRRLAVVFGCLAAACHPDTRQQPGDPAPEPPAAPMPVMTASAPAAPQPAAAAEAPADPYRADIENLCDAVNRSGADQVPPGGRQFAIAQWLGGHLQTEAAHSFLVHIQPLQGMAKADALLAEAKRVGLTECPLSAEWRGPNAVNPP